MGEGVSKKASAFPSLGGPCAQDKNRECAAPLFYSSPSTLTVNVGAVGFPRRREATRSRTKWCNLLACSRSTLRGHDTTSIYLSSLTSSSEDSSSEDSSELEEGGGGGVGTFLAFFDFFSGLAGEAFSFFPEDLLTLATLAGFAAGGGVATTADFLDFLTFLVTSAAADFFDTLSFPMIRKGGGGGMSTAYVAPLRVGTAVLLEFEWRSRG